MLLFIKIIAVILGIALLIGGFILQLCAICKEVLHEGEPVMWRLSGNALEIIGVFGAAYVVFCL